MAVSAQQCCRRPKRRWCSFWSPLRPASSPGRAACAAENERSGSARARPLFAVRPAVGETTWDLLAHLDDQQASSSDDAYLTAARHLLWRVAHLNPRGDAAIAHLTARAHDGELSSAEQLWAAADDLTALAVASPRDVRRSVPQLAVLYRYESHATR